MAKDKEKTISRAQAIEAIAGGSDLAERRGLNNAAIDFIYAFSAMNHRQEKYDDAIRGFRFLCRHRHRDPDMWHALARSLFAKREYLPALQAYLMVSILRPTAALCLEIARAFMAASMLAPAKVFTAAARRALLPRDQNRLGDAITQLEKEMA